MLEGRRSSVHNTYSPENMDSELPAPQFLGTIVGESVVEFLTRAVLDVGRGLYKYLDQLYSLLSAHTLKESSFDHYNQGPGDCWWTSKEVLHCFYEFYAAVHNENKT